MLLSFPQFYLMLLKLSKSEQPWCDIWVSVQWTSMNSLLTVSLYMRIYCFASSEDKEFYVFHLFPEETGHLLHTESL